MKNELRQLDSSKNIKLQLQFQVRKGWDEAFKKMALVGDDTLLDQEHLESSFDLDDWDW